jgi:hypothetical protein
MTERESSPTTPAARLPGSGGHPTTVPPALFPVAHPSLHSFASCYQPTCLVSCGGGHPVCAAWGRGRGPCVALACRNASASPASSEKLDCSLLAIVLASASPKSAVGFEGAFTALASPQEAAAESSKEQRQPAPRVVLSPSWPPSPADHRLAAQSKLKSMLVVPDRSYDPAPAAHIHGADQPPQKDLSQEWKLVKSKRGARPVGQSS